MTPASILIRFYPEHEYKDAPSYCTENVEPVVQAIQKSIRATGGTGRWWTVQPVDCGERYKGKPRYKVHVAARLIPGGRVTHYYAGIQEYTLKVANDLH